MTDLYTTDPTDPHAATGAQQAGYQADRALEQANQALQGIHLLLVEVRRIHKAVRKSLEDGDAEAALEILDEAHEAIRTEPEEETSP